MEVNYKRNTSRDWEAPWYHESRLNSLYSPTMTIGLVRYLKAEKLHAQIRGKRRLPQARVRQRQRLSEAVRREPIVQDANRVF